MRIIPRDLARDLAIFSGGPLIRIKILLAKKVNSKIYRDTRYERRCKAARAISICYKLIYAGETTEISNLKNKKQELGEKS